MAQENPNVLPWWQNGKIVTFLGTIAAAALPVTTFVGGYVQKETELALNAQKQSHEIRMDYINRALTPNMTEVEKELVFALFVEMEDQPALQRWGEKHHASLISKIKQLENRLQQNENEKIIQEKIVKNSDKAEEELEITIAEKVANNVSEADVEILKVQLRHERKNAEVALAKLHTIKEETDQLRVRVGESTDRVDGNEHSAEKLVNKFSGSERKVASSDLVTLYKSSPESVVNALIAGIVADQSNKQSYRVNLYVAYTLANIPTKWRGTMDQKNKVEALRLTHNYKNDKTFKLRVDQAINKYGGT